MNRKLIIGQKIRDTDWKVGKYILVAKFDDYNIWGTDQDNVVKKIKWGDNFSWGTIEFILDGRKS